MKSFEVQISAGFYIGTALSVLLLPWSVLISFFIATAFHEVCHLAALHFCRVRIQGISLGPFGAKITTGAVQPAQELICAAAGPAGSLLLPLFAKWMPIAALFGLTQGLFNLLPVYPLDGGRMIRAIFVLAKMASCDYNRPDHKQRGNYHD